MGSALSANRTPSASLYTKLDGDEIRVLELSPADKFNDPIRLRLFTKRLSENPEYKALSYVWGDPNATSTVYVNDIAFEATHNLDSALRHIRATSLDSNLYLWADAICINQCDLQERGQQVRLMARIYKTASEAIAWLGDSSEDSDAAFRLMQRWWNAILASGLSLAIRLTAESNTANLINGTKDISNPFSVRDWASLCSMYRRRYWTRLWTLQEFVLPQRVTLLCGKMHVDSRGAILLYLVFWYSVNIPFLAKDAPKAFEAFKTMSSFLLSPAAHPVTSTLMLRFKASNGVGLAYPTEPNPDDQSVLDLIKSLSVRGYSDPRDVLFATVDFWNAPEAGEIVDYRRSVPDTYRLFARTFIKERHFEILCCAGIGRTKECFQAGTPAGLPSYAPDWQDACNPSILKPHPLDYKCYSAGMFPRQSSPRHPVTLGNTFVSIPGICCDTVDAVVEGVPGTPPTAWWTPISRLSKDIFQSIRNRGTKAKHRNGLPWLRAFFNTMITFDGRLDAQGRVWTDMSPQSQVQYDLNPCGQPYASYQDLMNAFLPLYCTEDDAFINELHKDGADPEGSVCVYSETAWKLFFQDNEPVQEEHKTMKRRDYQRVLSQLFKLVCLSCYQRSFFLTKKGYMGLGPAFAKEGDQVYIFQDARVPFLLRRHGDGYQLVGEAFVSGLMSNEEVIQEGYGDEFEDVKLY